MKQLLRSRKELVIVVAALLAHLVLLSAQALQAQTTPLLRSWSLGIAAPMLKRFSGSLTRASRAWYGYVDLRNARQENQALRRQVAEYRQALINSEEKLKEADRLTLLNQMEEALKRQSIKARVIGWDANQWSNTRIIDKGTDDGVSFDCAALCPEGIVGRVAHVSRRSAVVQLITDTDSGVGVLLENSRAQGVMKGGGRREASIEYISSSEKVVIGEKVLTSGLDQIYPKGLLVGYVASVSPAKQVFQRIEVSITANLQKLEDVLILKKEPKE